MNIKKLLKLVSLILICFSLANCQTISNIATTVTTSKTHKEIIREEKRKQSEADLPFRGLDTSLRLDRIAFGSCADQDQPEPIWTPILNNKPDLFVFMGDDIYASRAEQKPIAEQYKKLNRIPEYRAARESIPFMATWDDHDYGQNDGGGNNPEKETARNDFLKYWNYVKWSLPKDQKALYHSKIFGSKKQLVQVILLDTRWDRSPLKKNEADTYNNENPEPNTYPRPYVADEDTSKRFLSEEQWKWLESELKKPAAFRVLVSSIQVIANDHGFEKWGNFPHERERLFNLIKKTKAKNLVILSGDRHMSAIAKTEIPGFGPLYDITSSGLNKTARPGNMLVDSSYLADGYGRANFGLIKMNWDKRKALLEIRSLEDEVKHSVEVNF